MFTPIDLQGKGFKMGFGYDKKDVDAFFREVIKDYEQLYRENLELTDKINVLSEGVQYYKSIETTLQKALVLAEKAAHDTESAAIAKADAIKQEAIANAQMCKQEALLIAETCKQEAALQGEELVANARQEAQNIILDAKKDLNQLQLETASLLQVYEQYKIQYKQLIVSQLELIENKAFDLDFSKFATLFPEDVDELVEEEMPTEDCTSILEEEKEDTFSAETIENKEVVSVENDEDFIPIIDIKSILAEVEAQEKEKKQQQEVSEVDSLTELKPDEEEVTTGSEEEAKHQELSEKELLEQLLGKSVTLESKTELEEDFEFLNI